MPPKQKISWSRDATLELIELYGNWPILYMVRSPGYKNKNKRQAALVQICAQLNKRVEFTKSVCIEDIKQKIHILRTQYHKELQKVKAGERSGMGTSSVHVPSLWCYSKLNFLRNSNADVIFKSEFNAEEKSGEMTEFMDEKEIMFEGTLDEPESLQMFPPATNFVSTPTTEPLAKSCQCTEEEKRLATASSALEQHSSAKNNSNVDDLEAFGISVVQELRKIKSGGKVRTLKRQIFNAILDMQETEEDGDTN